VGEDIEQKAKKDLTEKNEVKSPYKFEVDLQGNRGDSGHDTVVRVRGCGQIDLQCQKLDSVEIGSFEFNAFVVLRSPKYDHQICEVLWL
jgi:hypothetical protein